MKAQTTRDERAARILQENGVTLQNAVDRTYNVQSQANPAKHYRVNLRKGTCDCKDFERTGYACKHMRAAQKFETNAKRATAAAPQYKNYDELFAALAPKPAPGVPSFDGTFEL